MAERNPRNVNSLRDEAREGTARGRAGAATPGTGLQAGGERVPARRRVIVSTEDGGSGDGEGRGTTKSVSKNAATRAQRGSSSAKTGSRGGARRNEK